VAPQPPPLDVVLTTLINSLATAPSDAAPLILVLDDYHQINTPAIHDQIRFLVERLPSSLRLVLASRADPPLPLARWRARNELIELRAVDLRFSTEEAAAFLTEVVGLELGPAEVAALEARTEGWIAGLHLAGLAMRDRTDLPGFVATFTGSNRFVIDFL
jgi:LuxR family maltose regulon positive regulatory protein